MRYLLSILLAIGFVFAQKTTVIKKITDDEKKIEVKVKVTDDKMHYSVTEDGKTKEYEADLDDEKALKELHKKLAAHGLDEELKIIGCKKSKKHACIWDKCHPAACKHMENFGGKNIKILKHHKMMDDPIFFNENAGYLGVHIQDLSEQLGEYFKVKDGKGVLVSEVEKNSPAKKAGIKAGDIITKINGKEVTDSRSLTKMVRAYEPDTKVGITVLRNGNKKQFKAKLDKSDNAFTHDFEIHEFGTIDSFDVNDDKHKMLLKMYGDEDVFDFHGLIPKSHGQQAELDELRKELDEVKKELKRLKANK